MTNTIDLDSVLGIKYPEVPRWSPHGKYLAFLRDDGGVKDLWIFSPEENKLERVSGAEGFVDTFSWSPSGNYLLYSQNGTIWKAGVAQGKLNKLIDVDGKARMPSWSPDGRRFAFVLEGNLWEYSFESGGLYQLTTAGNIIDHNRQKGPIWSPDGSLIAFTCQKNSVIKTAIVEIDKKEIIWESEGQAHLTDPIWLSDRTKLVVTRTSLDHTQRAVVRIDLSGGDSEVLVKEQDEKGLSPLFTKTLSPSKDMVALILGKDGWAHIWVKYLESDELVRITDGKCEDVGHALDSPCWSPGGGKLAFSSNRGSLGERQIWLVSVQDGGLGKITSLPGTNLFPQWSPDGKSIAFIHCGPYHSPDIWIVRLEDKDHPIQITRSMPEAFSKHKVVVPKEISYKSAEGWKIHSYLLKPQSLTEGRKYPAIIWLHGGPIRQMRLGWHPSRVYSIFYSFHQYLLQKGYVVLMVNYRGGIGYGRKFEHGNYLNIGINDCRDVKEGANYLKNLDFVDPDRIGVWGISYGGYLTLQSLSRYPDTFKVGINIAGVVDWADLIDWEESKQPQAASYFKARLGGDPKKNPQAYYQASPINLLADIKAPLLNLQGTNDQAVPFHQLDKVVKKLVQLGKDFEVTYYPEEQHGFRNRSSWKDAFRRVESFFAKHLAGG